MSESELEKEKAETNNTLFEQGWIEHLYSGRKEVWKPNEEIELTLHYDGYGRGRSAVTFYWKDDNGHKYPMFIKDVDELLRQDMGTSSVRGIFTYVKRGANYGIKFLRKVE